jgi:hypothetical protein
VDGAGGGHECCVGLGEAATWKGKGVPGGDLDPTAGRELSARLVRLTEHERSVLEQLSAGAPEAEVAPTAVLTDIKRKLGVRSTLAAVAVLVRAERPD